MTAVAKSVCVCVCVLLGNSTKETNAMKRKLQQYSAHSTREVLWRPIRVLGRQTPERSGKYIINERQEKTETKLTTRTHKRNFNMSDLVSL